MNITLVGKSQFDALKTKNTTATAENALRKGQRLNRKVVKYDGKQKYFSTSSIAINSGITPIGKNRIPIKIEKDPLSIEERLAEVESEFKKDARNTYKMVNMLNKIARDFREIDLENLTIFKELEIKANYELENFQKCQELIKKLELQGVSLRRESFILKIKVAKIFGSMEEVEKLHICLCNNYSDDPEYAKRNLKMLAIFYGERNGIENKEKALALYDDIKKHYCNGRPDMRIELGRAKVYTSLGGRKNLDEALAIYNSLRQEGIDKHGDAKYRYTNVEVDYAKLCILMEDGEYLDDALKHLQLANRNRIKAGLGFDKNINQGVAEIYRHKSDRNSLLEAEKIYIKLIKRFEKVNQPHQCNNPKTMLGLAEVYIDLEEWDKFDKLDLSSRKMRVVEHNTQLCFAIRYFEECLSSAADNHVVRQCLTKAIKHAHQSIKLCKKPVAVPFDLLACCAQIAACSPDVLITKYEMGLLADVANKVDKDVFPWQETDDILSEKLNKLSFFFSVHANRIDPHNMQRHRMKKWIPKVTTLTEKLPYEISTLDFR